MDQDRTIGDVMPYSELDIEDPVALTEYLWRTGRIPHGLQPGIRVLDGGVSNRTVLVEVSTTQRWVLKQALARLRVQVDWFSDPRRIKCEALGLRILPRLTPPGTIPELIFEDLDVHVLAMTAVPEPHANWKQLLLTDAPEPDHVRQFAMILGQIHAHSYEQAAVLGPLLDNRVFFKSLRLEPYYSYAVQQVPETATALNALIEETLQVRMAVVHGDYSPKNILIHHGQLILLDHEVIHWGDPSFDVGFALTHLLSKAHHRVVHREAFFAVAQEFWDIYQGIVNTRFGPQFESRTVRHLAACLLARVAGRSPLEYLDAAARERQLHAARVLITNPPECIPDLITIFREEITR